MMIRSAAALLLALLISRAVPRARARGHGTAAAFPRYTGQQPPYPETNQASASVRSLEMDNFKVEEVPEINKSNSPVILKLYPPVVKPEAVHANLPLRFGRSSPRGALWLLRSPLTLTRRLGRSSETDSSIALACHQCGRAGGVAAPSVTHPQRFGRTNRFYNTAAQPLRSQGRGLALGYADDLREDDFLNFPKDGEGGLRLIQDQR